MTDPTDPWANILEELGDHQPAPQSPSAPESAPEPAPRARRRRSGDDEAPRRRRGRKTEVAPAAEADPFSAGLDAEPSELFTGEEGTGEPGAEGDGEPRKRRRRRSRRKKPGEGEPVAVGEPGEAAEGEAESEPEADTGPIENYSNLNMPSWQELINGLYKPG